MADVDRFSESYSEARSKFLAAAEAANARVDTYDNPNRGPDGDGLHTDVASLGSNDAEGVLLLGSGTHGVEGFCGSGIQTGLLQDGIEKRLPPNLRLVMVHAINPYGFSYLRRVNEDNIDLNRNFVDHSEPYRKNTNYDALAKVINPRPYWPLSSGASITYLLLYQVIHGRAALQSAITSGQHFSRIRRARLAATNPELVHAAAERARIHAEDRRSAIGALDPAASRLQNVFDVSALRIRQRQRRRR